MITHNEDDPAFVACFLFFFVSALFVCLYCTGDKLSHEQIDALFTDAGESGGHINYESKSANVCKACLEVHIFHAFMFFPWTLSVPQRAQFPSSFALNCSLLGTDNILGQLPCILPCPK